MTDGLKLKIEYSIELLNKTKKMAMSLDADNGFYLAFSGGKDSQAIYHLAQMAGVKFKAHMNLTSIDPPELIRFVKTQYPDVELIKPKMSIYKMAIRKRILPTRTKRWCCAEYKEMSGAGKVTLTGIRKQESPRRAKREEISTKIKGKRTEETFDQWSEHEELMISCVRGKDKIIISPIIYWTERDVWEFLNKVVNVPHCVLYDQGYRRIGCICCPMSPPRQKLREITRWPHVYRNWLKTMALLMEQGYINYDFDSPEFGLEWWISGKSFEKFYADSVMQYKLNL